MSFCLTTGIPHISHNVTDIRQYHYTMTCKSQGPRIFGKTLGPTDTYRLVHISYGLEVTYYYFGDKIPCHAFSYSQNGIFIYQLAVKI